MAIIRAGVLFAISLGLVIRVSSAALSERSTHFARTMAEKIANQIVEESRLNRSSRSIASSSYQQNKQDPWGNPFRIELSQPKSGKDRYVIVWSVGPNGMSESSMDWLELKSQGPQVFGGDDIGVVIKSQTTE